MYFNGWLIKKSRTFWLIVTSLCSCLSRHQACLGFLLVLNQKMSGHVCSWLCALLSSQWQKTSAGDLGEVVVEGEEEAVVVVGEAESQRAEGEVLLWQQLREKQKKGKKIIKLPFMWDFAATLRNTHVNTAEKKQLTCVQFIKLFTCL